MKAAIALTALVLLSGCNQTDQKVYDYNFKVSHVRSNSYVAVYHCDDFIITDGYLTFVDQNGVKRSISGDIDITFRSAALTKKYF